MSKPNADDHLGIDAHIEKRFEIIKLVGKGAYGIVWRAIDRKTKQVVALKKVFDGFSNQTDAQRTYREVMFLQRIHHDNVVRLLSVHKAENHTDLYLVFEFIDTDLYATIRSSLLQEIHKRFITYQLLRCTRFLHKHGLIHRDLKPANLLLNSDCHAKVADFGLARSLVQLERDGPKPILTDYVATRWYRPPEIVVGSVHYSRGIDLWAIGTIIGEMLTGKPLLPGTSTMNQMERIVAMCGQPSQEDVRSLRSGYAEEMFRNMKPVAPRPLKQALAMYDKQAVDLMTKLLVFNPDKRMGAAEAMCHPYVAQFCTPEELVPDDGPVTDPILLPVPDADRLDIEDYRDALYREMTKQKREARDKRLGGGGAGGGAAGGAKGGGAAAATTTAGKGGAAAAKNEGAAVESSSSGKSLTASQRGMLKDVQQQQQSSAEGVTTTTTTTKAKTGAAGLAKRKTAPQSQQQSQQQDRAASQQRGGSLSNNANTNMSYASAASSTSAYPAIGNTTSSGTAAAAELRANAVQARVLRRKAGTPGPAGASNANATATNTSTTSSLAQHHPYFSGSNANTSSNQQNMPPSMMMQQQLIGLRQSAATPGPVSSTSNYLHHHGTSSGGNNSSFSHQNPHLLPTSHGAPGAPGAAGGAGQRVPLGAMYRQGAGTQWSGLTGTGYGGAGVGGGGAQTQSQSQLQQQHGGYPPQMRKPLPSEMMYAGRSTPQPHTNSSGLFNNNPSSNTSAGIGGHQALPRRDYTSPLVAPFPASKANTLLSNPSGGLQVSVKPATIFSSSSAVSWNQLSQSQSQSQPQPNHLNQPLAPMPGDTRSSSSSKSHIGGGSGVNPNATRGGAGLGGVNNNPTRVTSKLRQMVQEAQTTK